MGNCLSTLRQARGKSQSREQLNTQTVHTSTSPPPLTDTVEAVAAPSWNLETTSTTSTSNNRHYTVFISHAGEDKTTIAIPLREKLVQQCITTFVDEIDIRPGMNAERVIMTAMKTAQVAVIVLSPEFVARKWPMKELFFFLRRYQQTQGHSQRYPIIIPFFYRLTIPELYHEPRFDRVDDNGNSHYEASRFFQRMKAGEPEANIDNIKKALSQLHQFMGLRNYLDATNGTMFDMTRKRNILLNDLCNKVREALPNQVVTSQVQPITIDLANSHEQAVTFRKSFPPPSIGVKAVLDFDTKDHTGNLITTEGLIKHCLREHTVGIDDIITIYGIGGVGKSTIARALAADHDIRAHFPDGVHMINLGQDATKVTVINQVCQVLRSSGAEKTERSVRARYDLNEALDEYERRFQGKRCAFIIDDAWIGSIGIRTISRLCGLGKEGNGSAVLVTTREHDVASLAPRKKMFHLKPRDVRGKQSQKILFMHADQEGMEVGDGDITDPINKILDVCAGLPVSLMVAGKGVKKVMIGMVSHEQEAWNQYLQLLLVGRETMLQKDMGEYGNLYATFATALAFLDATGTQQTLGFKTDASFAEMHRWLCVLEKRAKAPCSMLKHLWGVKNVIHAEMVGRTFVEIGLATEDHVMKKDNDRASQVCWGLKLHDSIHDYAVFEAKRCKETMNAHERLLTGYRSFEGQKGVESSSGGITSTKWWDRELVDDYYVHFYLFRHLQSAGYGKEIVWLMMRPAWTARQLELYGLLGLEANFSTGMKAMEEINDLWWDETGTERSEVERALELILEAVRLSWPYIITNFREIWFQLYGRLKRMALKYKCIMEYISEIEKEAVNPSCLPWLRSENCFLTEPGGANKRIFRAYCPVQCMLKIPKEDWVVCGLQNGSIIAGNVNDSQMFERRKVHDDAVSSIAVGRNGTRVISGSKDKTAKVWDVESRTCLTTLMGNMNHVQYVAIMRDGNRVIIGSEGESAQVWDLETSRVLSQLFKGHENLVRCIALLPDGEQDHIVTGGEDGRLRLWDLTGDVLVGEPFVGHQSSVTCLTVTPDGRHVVSGSDDKTIRIWNFETREQVGELKGHSSSISCVSVSEDGRRIAAGVRYAIQVWDMESKEEICDPLQGHTGTVTGVLFLKSGDSIVSCSDDETIRSWDLKQKVEGLEGRHEHFVTSVAFTPNGMHVVSCSFDRTVRIWDVKSGRQVGNPLKGSRWRCVAVTPDGSRVVFGCMRKVLVWDLQSRQILRNFTGHTGPINWVAVARNGRYAVTGSDDKTVRVWDLGDMDREHVVLEGHSANVERVYFSDDVKRVVSVSKENRVIVWELESKACVRNVIVRRACCISRKKVMDCIGEATDEDDAGLDIMEGTHTIWYEKGENRHILAHVEGFISAWALSPDKETICVGLMDGKVGFMKLIT